MNTNTEIRSPSTRSSSMSDIHIVNDYPHRVEQVWRALTDPALIPLWTKAGLGGRAEGFWPVAGTKFRLVAKPQPWWRGFVECEVVEARAPSLLRYWWIGDEGESPSLVSYQLEPIEAGTRFIFDHTGFSGIGGFMVSKVLRRVSEEDAQRGLAGRAQRSGRRRQPSLR
jgi:uncharacterized protein YndB with AHSA1/START domain